MRGRAGRESVRLEVDEQLAVDKELREREREREREIREEKGRI